MSLHEKRGELFSQAVLWLEEKGGEDAVVRAFGDPEPLDAIWTLGLEDFKEALRSRMSAAIEVEEGAA